MTRILDDANEILYFTEEQGVGNGVHARDSSGRYYSILEGIDYNDETSGLCKFVDAIRGSMSLFCTIKQSNQQYLQPCLLNIFDSIFSGWNAYVFCIPRF